MTGLQNGSNPSYADYDLRAFARVLRGKRALDPRGMRDIADQIGVTLSDFSRAMGGQMVSVGKVIALCQWLDVPVERFYLPPEKPAETGCFTRTTVKHEGRVRP